MAAAEAEAATPLSKQDYEQQMQALQAKLSSTANELTTAFSNPSDIPAMTAGLNKTADLLDEASQSLDDIEPPEDVADAHQAMVDNSAAAADKIRDLADKVENDSLSELQSDVQDFQNFPEFAELQTGGRRHQGEGLRHRRQLARPARAVAGRAWRRRGASAAGP